MKTKSKSGALQNYTQPQIIYFIRKSINVSLSIEELFDAITSKIGQFYRIQKIDMPYLSTGIKNRWLNGLYAKRKKGLINHITGDIHYLALFLPRERTVLTIHDCAELENHKGIKKFILWLLWFYLPVKKLKYITVISEATKTHLLRYVNVNPDKIRVITNCLIGNYSVSKKEFNADKPTILQVGITVNKNIERIAQALHGIPCTLKIIGTPSESQVAVLNQFNIEFECKTKLTRDEVITEYANCDMLVFVSLIEGFGLPIIEAQASGKPVLTSNISPMIDTAGKGAGFVNPLSVQEIKQGILKIITDKEYRNKLIEAGLENYKRFDPEQISQAYIQLYELIIREQKYN